MNNLDGPMMLEDVHCTQTMPEANSLSDVMALLPRHTLLARGSQVTSPTSRLGLFVRGNNGSQAIVNARAQIEVATAFDTLVTIEDSNVPADRCQYILCGDQVPLENVDRDSKGREEGVLVLGFFLGFARL